MNLVAEALATGAVASPQVIRHSKRMVARDSPARRLHRRSATRMRPMR